IHMNNLLWKRGMTSRPMRQRIIDSLPVQVSSVRGCVVEIDDDDTFGFSYFDKEGSIDAFYKHAIDVGKNCKVQAF
ncbi:hypothetical protein CWC25_22810, partial [Pseudoalteromonas sp. S4389]